MSNRRLLAFIDALAAGRRPPRFRADPADAPLLRTAIELRAARPGEAQPSEQFVADLHKRLSAQAAVPEAEPRPVRPRRGALTLAAAAAGGVLVAGTFAVTDAFDHSSSTPTAIQAPSADAVRTGTFVGPRDQVLGQIVAFRGKPSWVFMKVAVPHYDGPLTCELQAADGSFVAYGTFSVHNGVGQWSKTISSPVGALRGAKLVDANGSPVATATFA
jgi:hypothetical protein